MPKAIRSTDTEKHELKSLPGGYVVARKLSYGEKQRRMQIASGQSIHTQARSNGQPDKVDVSINSFDIQQFDFMHCIIEHNLFKDDDERVKFNFRNALDLMDLDDAIGQEIEAFLDELNNDEAETPEAEATFQESDAGSDSKEEANIGAGS